MSKELVSHPSHYNKEGRSECWDEMISLFGYGAVIHFDLLSAYKYYYRAGSKDDNPKEQDLAKINAYIEHAREMIVESELAHNDVRGKKRMLNELLHIINNDCKEV
jgi:hypothetical protein